MSSSTVSAAWLRRTIQTSCGWTTELERWREQGCPLCGTTAPPSFSGNGAIGSTCAAYCLLHTSVLCHVNKQLSECSRVTGMRAGALYQSFFSTIWNYSRNGGRERAKLSLFHQSQSLSLSLSLTHTHTHTD